MFMLTKRKNGTKYILTLTHRDSYNAKTHNNQSLLKRYLNVNNIASLLTIIITFSALLGFSLLNAYSTYQRIPFPVSDAGLEVALFLKLLLIVFISILAFYLPALIRIADEEFEKNSSKLIVSIIFYFIWFTLLFIIFYPFLLNKYFKFLVYAIYAISIIILISIRKGFKKNNSERYPFRYDLLGLIISAFFFLAFLAIILLFMTNSSAKLRALLSIIVYFILPFVLVGSSQILYFFEPGKNKLEQDYFFIKNMTKIGGVIIGSAFIVLFFAFIIYLRPAKSQPFKQCKELINNVLNLELSELRVGGNVPIKLEVTNTYLNELIEVKNSYLNKLINKKLLSHKFNNSNKLTTKSIINACLILKTNNGIYIRISKFIAKPIFIQNQYIVYDSINFNKKCTNN
jgi:hypothetical protein